MTNRPPSGDHPPTYGQPGPHLGYSPQGYPGMPPGTPPPAKSRKWLWIVLGVVGVLVVAAVGVGALVYDSASKNVLVVGDCLYFSSVSETPADTSHEKRPCSDPDATYEVGIATDGESTCDSDYFTYSLLSGDKTEQTLCLLPNLTRDSCYTPQDDGRFLASACSDANAVKIGDRIDGSADESLCTEFGASSAVVYPTPPRTYCLAPTG